MELLQTLLHNFVDMFIDMSFYIMLGLFFVGLLNTYIKRDQILKHLGRDNMGAVVKASAIGVPLPLCSCGVVPTAVELKKAGASNGAVVSFLVSTPQTGVDSIFATYSMMGIVMAIFRPIAAFCSGIMSGIVVNTLAKDSIICTDAIADCHCGCESHIASTAQTDHCHRQEATHEDHCHCHETTHHHEKAIESDCHCHQETHNNTCHCHNEAVAPSCSCGCAHTTVASQKTLPKPLQVFRYAYGDFLDEISGHFMLGMLLATLITTFLPADFFIALGLDTGMLAMITMVIIGVPMYICSTSSIPIAISLMGKGLSLGSGFVFLFTGPVTNIASLLVLSKALGKKITGLYIACVSVCSIAFGLLLDWLVAQYNLPTAHYTTTMAHSESLPLFYRITAVVFAILITKGLYKLLRQKIKAHK